MPRVALAFLVVGLIAASQSGNIIRLGDAGPAVIAAWRLLLATCLLAPMAWRHRGALLALGRRDRGWLALGGVVLAGHFVTWIEAIQHTSVANAAGILALAPVLTSFGAWLLFGERIGWRFAAALLLGVLGVASIGAGDMSLAPGQVYGDLVAVGCMVLFSAYILLGRHLRRQLPNIVYVVCLYGVAALVCFGAVLAARQPLVDYSARTWLCFGLMALVPTVVGHTALNSALRYLDAGRAALATLTEPPMAALVAYLVWGEGLTGHGVAGFGLVCAAVVLMVRDEGPRQVRAARADV